MIPHGAAGIGHLAARIVAETLPKASDAYMGADLGMIAGLLGMVAQDYERGPAVFAADEADMRSLLEAGVAQDLSPALKHRVEAALASRPAGLRTSEMAAHLDSLMRPLIDLHAAVEDAEAAGAAWAAALNREIWRFLEAHVARRAYDSAF
jgi:hypothetical protein